MPTAVLTILKLCLLAVIYLFLLRVVRAVWMELRASGTGPDGPEPARERAASQLHARVFTREGRWYVEDLGSTNGTWLNRKRVHGPLPMSNGDRIAVGDTVLEFRR